MALLNCENRRDCTGIAFVVSLIIGIVTAFLQITAVITFTPIFAIVAFSIAILYLAVTLIAVVLTQKAPSYNGACVPISALLLGILGTILFSVILIAIAFPATSVIGAIIIGALFFSFSLMITSTACLARHFVNCNN